MKYYRIFRYKENVHNFLATKVYKKLIEAIIERL